MAVIFYDRFEEAATTLLDNHAPDQGVAWTPLYNSAATAVIQVKPNGQSNAPHVVGPSTSENSVTALYGIAPSPATADVTLEADRFMLNWDVSNSYSAGMFARVTYTTGWSGYFLQMVPNLNAAASLRLYKMVLGVTTLLASYDHAFTNGDVITFECKDAAKRVLVNGVERIAHADNAVAGAGFAGLYWGNFVVSSHMRAEMEFGTLTVADATPAGQTVDLAATPAGVGAASGALALWRSLVATAAGVATASGTLAPLRHLEASASSAVVVTAALVPLRNVSATVASGTAVTATVAPLRGLVAVADGDTGIVADLNVGAEVLLAVAVSGSAGVGAALAVTWTLGAQADGQGDVSVSGRALRSLAAAIGSVTTVTASLDTLGQIALASSLAGDTTVMAQLAATRDFAAQADAPATAAAGLAADYRLHAQIATLALASAALDVLSFVLLAASSVGATAIEVDVEVTRAGAVGDLRTWAALASDATLADALFAHVRAEGRLATVAAVAIEQPR